MKKLRAVLLKQFKDTLKNPATLIQFIIYPLLAFGLSQFVDFDAMFKNMENLIVVKGMSAEQVEQALSQAKAVAAGVMPNMTTMQATIFAGMGLIPVVAGIIAEDREKKSVRFLMMAGVKSPAYLIGVSGIILFLSFLTSVAFSIIGGYSGSDFWIFLASMMSGVSASIVLGATIGMFAGNQQTATGLAMPLGIILGIGPIMAQFSEGMKQGLRFFYTQQLNVIADNLALENPETSLGSSFGIIWMNIAVLFVLFMLVYAKKGLKETNNIER